jgi:uncharacterized membrane protein
MTFYQMLSVIFTAMLPYLELRGAIPLAIALGASPLEALFFSLIGNMLPILPLMLILPVLAKWADRNPWIDRFLRWLTEKVGRKKHNINKYGPIGLAIFVAVPLPMTGAWSGAVLAFLLGLRKRHAFLAIFAGTFIAGIIVTMLTVGATALF